MKSHRQFVRRLRRLAIGLAAIGALVPASAASALQDPGSSPSANEGGYLRPIPSLSAKQYADAYHAAVNSGAKQYADPLNSDAKVGDTPADFPGASRAPGVALNAATRVGDTPADFPGASRAPGVGLDSATKVGDTPADFPGASRAPDIAPPTIQVVRPERTIVRDVNEVLPIVLSGAALLIVLMGATFVLVRVRLERRHAVGRSH